MGCSASAPSRGVTPPAPGVIHVQQHSSTSRKAVAEASVTFRQRSSADLARRSIGSAGEDRSVKSPKFFELTDKATPQQVLNGLLEGNERFLEGSSAHPHQDFQRLAELAAKQKPLAAILGCADSRVPPEIAFDQGFGDVFVCRVAGNIATPEEIASLEYAVLELGVKVVMVLGHTKCGAVKAALSGNAFPGFIDTLVDNLDVAVSRAMSEEEVLMARGGDADMLDKVVSENVKYQVQRCKRSSVLTDAINGGKMLIVGAVYDLDTGRVEVLEEVEVKTPRSRGGFH